MPSPRPEPRGEPKSLLISACLTRPLPHGDFSMLFFGSLLDWPLMSSRDAWSSRGLPVRVEAPAGSARGCLRGTGVPTASLTHPADVG